MNLVCKELKGKAYWTTFHQIFFINSRLRVYYLPTTFPNLLLFFDVSENGEELVDVPLEELCAGHGKISMPQFDCLVKEVAVCTSKMSAPLSHERFQ